LKPVAPRTFDGSRSYLDLARFAAEWQRNRAEGFERKSVALLGLVGVTVALMPHLLPLIGQAHGGHVRASLQASVALAALGLIGSAFASLLVLWPRRVASPLPLGQFGRLWDTYRRSGGSDDEAIVATFANMLIGQVEDRPLSSMKTDADRRGIAFICACTALFVAVTALATFLIILTFTRG